MIDYDKEIEIINELIDRLTSTKILDLTNKDVQDVCHILLRYKVWLQQANILQKRGIE